MLNSIILKESNEAGWVYLYSFICLSAGVVEWQPYYFVIILWHHASPNVASVLVLFAIFGGLLLVLISQVGLNRLPLAASLAYPMAFHSALLHRGYSQRIGGS